MSNTTKKLSLNRLIGLGLVAAIIVGLLAYAGYNTFKQQDQAKASFSTTDCTKNPLEMQPGSTCGFVLTYTNGEGAETADSIFSVYIGSELVIDAASITDEMFVNGVSRGVFPVSLANINQANPSPWGNQLKYLPGSAKTANTPSGSSTPGTLPASTTGKLFFSATLKSDVISRFSANTILQPRKNNNGTGTEFQGISIDLAAGGSVSGDKNLQIKVLASDVYTTTGKLTGTIGSAIGGTVTISPSVTNSAATYTNGGSCSIPGTIAGNVFTPTAGNVPAGCPTGANTAGKITITTGNIVVSIVNTEFVGYTSTGKLTGTIGSVIGGTIDIAPTIDNGAATYTNGGSCSIPGTITANKTFTPTAGNVPAGCPTGANTAGKITSAAGTVVNNINTEFIVYTTTGKLTGTIGSAIGGTVTISPSVTNSAATYTNGGSCSIPGTIAGNVFTPTAGNVPAGCPTSANTAGKITITTGNIVVSIVNTEFVAIVVATNCDDRFGDNCRLYFVGADNKAVVWDKATQTNTGWDIAQKYKDGTAKIVFDNIKKSNGAQIANGSACNFEMIKYGTTPVLKTIAGSTTASGLTQANFVVDDQTINYYTVSVTCTETGTNEIIKDYDRLVLIVGGQGGRQDPVVDF